ncbi:berberine bridge enzyme-like 18 [Olea europaea var. sylvestris]|uniref:Berberine bridge enzyme-like 18 n=1 Tax=Olea europaea subsp. europaea TaxID=158383 RepID=A0A8S0TXX4_OLEEU|nr:berberine bridge enzyme-like 18 [Olea europaea var. sylvestris]CAA3008458.1 berberine bridge enzyme-like 18 [Olea europaea subsp. europaea]
MKNMVISGSTFPFSLLAFILILGASSAFNKDDFFECLTLQYQKSNSETDSIYTPKNASYSFVLQSAIHNLRSESNSAQKPVVIITPEHESEIQAAVYCSKKLKIQLRVRSGGHDYEGLSYVSETPFVIVDMRNIRSISIDKEKNTAWVQTGATLGELYYTIAKNSKTLAFTAGVCPNVGVGGHFSGGGYSMMSRKHGIAADHIIDAKLIDAHGQIHDRKSMGEDLFWAIRGGGGTSFGIVVAFKVQLTVIPETVTVFNVTRTLEQNATQLVHRWQYVADKIDENLLLRLFLRSINSSGRRTIGAFFTSLYLGRVDDLLPVMQKKFPELGLVKEDCTEMPWIESTLYFAGFQGQSLDVLVNRTEPFPPEASTPFFKGKSDYVKQPIPENGLEGIWEFLNKEDANRAELQFSPYGGRMNDFSESEIPFPHRAGNIFMIHYRVGWNLEENADSGRHMKWIRELYSFMARYVTKSPRAAYFNYRDLDLGMNNNEVKPSYKEASVWGVKYFKNNFKRLVQVKSKVDPTNFYRNEQSVPPVSSW